MTDTPNPDLPPSRVSDHTNLWFKIPSGEHEGRPHLRGWGLTAIRTEDGWLALAICPRCHALVLSDDKHAFGDQTWAHELWHAETDYPMPPEVEA